MKNCGMNYADGTDGERYSAPLLRAVVNSISALRRRAAVRHSAKAEPKQESEFFNYVLYAMDGPYGWKETLNGGQERKLLVSQTKRTNTI